MVEIVYPRNQGETKSVGVDQWVEAAPFGHCPACGSIGIEFGPCFECETMDFFCSDPECNTYVYEEMPTTDGKIVGRGSVVTAWVEPKPPEIRAMEANMQSWNSTHFSTEFMIKNDLV